MTLIPSLASVSMCNTELLQMTQHVPVCPEKNFLLGPSYLVCAIRRNLESFKASVCIILKLGAVKSKNSTFNTTLTHLSDLRICVQLYLQLI